MAAISVLSRKHASGPFLSMGQMAALCFVCLIFQSVPVFETEHLGNTS